MFEESPNTKAPNYSSVHAMLKDAFRRGLTRSESQRHAHLQALYRGIQKHEEALLAALKADLHKCATEAFSNEIGIVYAEITHARKHLRKWMRPQRVVPELHLMPGTARIIREPYGVSLILAPWNYPVQLLLSPLVGALAGGNTAILKPSELAVHTAEALATLIRDTFPPEIVSVVTGGPEVGRALLELPVDHIFFTGSVPVGRMVMEAATHRLTPLTLELGGKSPAVVAPDADIAVSARRIAWGKFNNAGQTCVAPDYVLVHRSRFEELVQELSGAVSTFYGGNPAESPHYGRIINTRHFDRLAALLEASTARDAAPLLHGGGADRAGRYIAPTIFGPVADTHPLMEEEIFGPLLPVQVYDEQEEAIERILARAKPLALYIFTRSTSVATSFTTRIPFGGGAVNTTVLQVASSRLPFGGVGPSGVGSYHGRYSFEAFTHAKSILRQPLRPDLGLAYPHKALGLSWIRRLLR